MTNYPEILYSVENALELKHFREMDYYAVDQYNLPIELMMENAGLHLASFVSNLTPKSKKIKIGVGNGNNGGGGLVAVRRLAAWGYEVFIDPFTDIVKPIPKLQLKRALAFGVCIKEISNPDVWIDAYLGFSQRLPLNKELILKMEYSRIRRKENQFKMKQILRCNVGLYILLALDFMITSDIISTMVHTDMDDLIVLGAIVVLRTVIGYFLGKEVEEVHNRGKSKIDGN